MYIKAVVLNIHRTMSEKFTPNSCILYIRASRVFSLSINTAISTYIDIPESVHTITKPVAAAPLVALLDLQSIVWTFHLQISVKQPKTVYFKMTTTIKAGEGFTVE